MSIKELKEYDRKYNSKNTEAIAGIEKMIKGTFEKMLEDIKKMSVEAIQSGNFVTEGDKRFNIKKAADDILRIEEIIDSIKSEDTDEKEDLSSTNDISEEKIKMRVNKNTDIESDLIMVYFKHNGQNARALFDKKTEKAILLKGNLCRIREGKNYSRDLSDRKKEYLESGILVESDKKFYELTKNIEFDTISKAGSFVSGWALTEYKSWRDSHDKKLNEIMGKNARKPFRRATK